MTTNGTYDSAGGLFYLDPSGHQIINDATTYNCTAVSELCPVHFTTYGYAPNMGANAFFCALFFLLCGANIYQGIKYKTWTYLVALGFGTLAEGIGYIGRIMLHNNAYSSNGFEVQICCLIIAPAFIAAGVYLTLKHIVIEFGASFSRLRPRLYTWIFIFCDILSLVLQGAGGGTAATANNGSNLQNVGTDLMITGIVWQVCTLLAFGSLVVDYYIKCKKNTLDPSGYALLRTTKFKVFVIGLVVSFFTILTRCTWRIAELGPGWKNPIMQAEWEFMLFDGTMILIASLCLTILHPGVFFKEMQMHKNNLPVAAVVEKEGDIEASGANNAGKPKKGIFTRRSKA